MKRFTSLKPWLKGLIRFIVKWFPAFLVSLLASIVANLITNWLFYKYSNGNRCCSMPAITAK